MPLHPPRQTPSANTDSVASPGIKAIRYDIARQSFKAALDRAKTLHRALATPDSQAILLEAYVARIRGMIAKDLLREGQALAELVLSRFPDAAKSLEQVLATLAAKTGDLAGLLRPLAELTSQGQWPQAVQDAILRDVSDPAAIAHCEALPQDHPLRVAAAALAQAFAAVTSGSVDSTTLALAECPRRSPLVNWKTLIRAIAALYEGRDQACRLHLAAVARESACACLVPAIEAVLAERCDARLSPSQRQLAQRVSGPILQLRTDLEQLDANIADENHRGIASGLKCVLPLCQQACPERLTRLKQHLYVKLDMLDLVDRTVVQALRPFPRPDAYFWRLFARDVELCGDFAFACFVWNHFRMNAVKEGLYSAGSPEDGFICLHMARQLRRLDPEELLERQEEHRYDPPDLQDYFRVDVFARTRADDRCSAGEIRATDYLHPDRLYRLACQQWPDPSAFQEWLEYGQLTEMSPAELEEMAGIWAQALPQDHRPWMALAHAAEERNAYNKALKYIGKAEQVARLDPIPRQARLRLLIAKTLRHFREEKLNLVPRDLDELRALAQAREGDRPAFVDALAWLHAVMTREMARAAESAARIEDRLGGALPGTLLRVSVAQAAACRDDRLRTLRKSLTGRKNSQLIQALIRVHPIGIDLDIEIPLPSAWEKRLTQWLKRSPCDLALTQLAILAEAALTACWDELAYCCTHHGLRSDGTHLAAFLLLRARSLPFTVEGRRQACLDVALELARRHRQMDLVAKIVNTKRTLSTLSWSPFDDGIRFDVDCDLEEEDLEDCLREERDAKQYPRPSLPARAGFARFGSGVLPGDRTKSGCGTQRGGGNHSGSQDHQMYLFDGFKEEDSDQEEGFDLAEPGPVLSLPRELVDALEALERNEPAAASELARLIVKYPKVGGKLAEAMAKNLGERR